MNRPAAYDANLKWEQTATYNAGLDYGFLNNRLNGSIDFYMKKTSNLLATVPIPAGSNFANTLLTNVGSIENKGVEFNINYTAIRTKKLTWDLNFNATYNVNKITKLLLVNDTGFVGTEVGDISGATGYKIQIHSIGYNTFAFYPYKQVYDKAGHPIEGAYTDLNKDGVISPTDRYRYKSPFPKVTLGFSTQVTYDKWALSTVLRANIGNYMYNNVASNLDRLQTVLNPLNYLQNATVDIKNTYFNYAQLQSDYYIQNASFLKMDNLGVSYNFGRIIDHKVGLIVNANCQNVFTVTKYKGVDPEIYGGIDNKFYPRSRIYTLGLNLNF
jgi:iron complex outermembrane receptor protein